MFKLQEEYDELLKYAVVVPTIDPGSLPNILHNARGSFLQDIMGQMNQQYTNGVARNQPGHHTSHNDDDGRLSYIYSKL